MIPAVIEHGKPGSSKATEAAASAMGDAIPLNWKTISLAWTPYAVMSAMLMFTGWVRQLEGEAMQKGQFVRFGSMQTNYLVPVPGLDRLSYRDPRCTWSKPKKLLPSCWPVTTPCRAATTLTIARQQAPGPEKAEFNFAWLTAPGTAVFVAALLSMLFAADESRSGWPRCSDEHFVQMNIPMPTIACMLGLSYVTRYSGMDATLGVAFAGTGVLYPFFAAILGWLGVFLTGTDAGSNALFGSLQKITATEVYNSTPRRFKGFWTATNCRCSFAQPTARAESWAK